ncbi:type II toxin-antitoxin system HicB family antitoxin [Candidatus Sordicultor fermentans]|jgi:predicted RNase H-like HicB family nuclease|uniref:type II toxin-antitoxin system HicB family antitoxin n=1 Tax=Candidatus Sordicultor fermentans TaxID=1953203 RepID=UPI0016B262C3|nr:type II toxin-antitoxin system HicB family antitoxin [Candidatus Atribacteria bacterium]
MKSINFVLWQEGRYYVAQCLNVDVSSFGETIEEAIDNLKEAVELYLEDKSFTLPEIEKVMIGREEIDA